MLTFQKIVSQQKNVTLEYRIRNLISCILIVYAGYTAFQAFLPGSHPMITLMIGMCIITATLCTAIMVIKIRQVYFSRKADTTLMESISTAIQQARLHGDYTLLNQLLDSTYSCHTILKMSELPEGAYDYSHLTKWVKLKEAMKYFRENKISIKDFYNLDKMNNYLISVYPEFIDALRKSDQKA